MAQRAVKPIRRVVLQSFVLVPWPPLHSAWGPCLPRLSRTPPTGRPSSIARDTARTTPRRRLSSPRIFRAWSRSGAEDGYFYAINEANQTVLWSRFLWLDEAKPGSCLPHAAGIVATATVADDPTTGTATVFVNAPDGHLYALNANTGASIWKGRVDTPSTTVNDYYAWSSPLVANGKVYVGASSEGDCPLVPGGLVAFDQSTGA